MEQAHHKSRINSAERLQEPKQDSAERDEASKSPIKTGNTNLAVGSSISTVLTNKDDRAPLAKKQS